MKIRKRHFKVELEVTDKAFEGEHLYTIKEIRKLIKNRLPYTLFIKKLKVKEIKNHWICPICKESFKIKEIK